LHPGTLKIETRKNIEDSWQAAYGGVENAGKIPLLEEGMTIHGVSMTNEDAEFLGSRQFSLLEVARMFGVPPHLIYYGESQPRANMEQASLEFVQYSLRDWLVRIEQSILKDLIPEEDREDIFAEFSVDGLLRGDFLSRMRGYAIGRQWGWLSANDVRRKENENPIEGGDEYLVPLNMGQPGENRDERDAGTNTQL